MVISLFILICPCVMVIATQIIFTYFNDQMPLNIECPGKKYLGDYVGVSVKLCAEVLSVFLCAFFFLGRRPIDSQSGHGLPK